MEYQMDVWQQDLAHANEVLAYSRGEYAARDREVEGNSVESVLGDVMHQEGEVLTMVDVNRNAMMRQLGREALSFDAQHDTAASQIAGSIRSCTHQGTRPGPCAEPDGDRGGAFGGAACRRPR